MSPGNAKQVVFINGDKNALSLRDRELQAAEARAHAARVSRRPSARAITTKEDAAGYAAVLGQAGVLTLRPNHKPNKSRVNTANAHKQEKSRSREKTRVHSASSLGQGLVDPFDTAPVTGLDNFVYSILDFAYDYAFPSFVPDAPTRALPTHRANRRRLGRQFGFLLEAQIAAAAKFQLSPMLSLSDSNRQRIQGIGETYEKRAVDSVNREIQSLDGLPSDTLIYASALLAYVSGPSYDWHPTRHPKSPLATAQNLHAMGNLEIVPERVQTVRTLIQLRGGIDELSMPFQRIVLTYLDTIVSTRLGIRPGWSWPAAIPESLQRTGEHILDQPAVQMMQNIGSGFGQLKQSEMRQTLCLMCEATVALDHCHRGGSSSPPTIWNVARLRVAVQHRLCTIEPITPDQTSADDLCFELCRLSALIYSDLVMFPIPDSTSVKAPLLYDLSRTLDRYQLLDDSSCIDHDLVAWCSILAAVASHSSAVFRPQLIKRFAELARKDFRLYSLDFCATLAKRYLWWDYLLNPLTEEVLKEIPPPKFLPLSERMRMGHDSSFPAVRNSM